MIRLFLLSGLPLIGALTLRAGVTTEAYIVQWKKTAVEQMREHSIPASITLAQGILESASGNSNLARTANNHFGIKCHVNWEGERFYMDDDARNECFRSYESADESYIDHSLFLTSRSHYAGLFDLKISDYKGWAKGLKKAGYATNPQYAELLIEIIERFGLSAFDKNPDIHADEKDLSAVPAEPISVPSKHGPEHEKNDEGNASAVATHKVHRNKWNTRYIVVQPGDTYYRIANEFKMGTWQLYNYNDLGKRDVLHSGEVIYLEPKKYRASKGYTVFVCTRETTLRTISQEEGLRLKTMMKLNFLNDPDGKIKEGTKIILR